MDIEKYRTFVVASDCSSFAAAAEKLFLTTPTVTKHISALEREMGVCLFDRTRQGVRLTEAGEARVALARQIVSAYDALNNLNARRTLLLHSIPCLEKIGVPAYLRGFSQARPEISVEVIERHGLGLAEDLLAERCEIAFLGDIYANSPELERIEIFSERLWAALPSNHPLAKRESLSLRELKDEYFIFISRETGVPQFYEKCCSLCGFRPKVKTVCSREDSVLSYVGSGLGVSLHTFGRIAKRSVDGVSFVPLEEDFFSGCVLARKKGRRISASANAFWKYMSNTMNI